MKKNQNMPVSVSAQQNGFGPEFSIAYTQFRALLRTRKLKKGTSKDFTHVPEKRV
jgi:hypothetical protein